MTADTFYLYLQHFVARVKCSQDRKVLLILDNHESHISIKLLIFSKQNGIILLTLPPHCSHKLQPLDVVVYYSFKNACDTASNEWVRDHPSRVITIYDVSQIIGKGFPISMTCTNIISGFRKTGIFPFNPSIFKEDDFLSSAVTDRQALPETLNEQELVEPVVESSKLPSKSAENFLVSSEQLLAFPNAGPRKQGKKGRKRLKSAILTDIPVKNNIENDLRNREKNKIKKLENAQKRTIEQLMKQKNTGNRDEKQRN